VSTPAHQQLAESYAALKVHCDAEAGKYKSRQMLAWVLAWASTAFIVVVCLFSLKGEYVSREWQQVFLNFAIPAASTCGTLVALYQQFRGPRGRWLRFRAATERLREHAMLYMLDRSPYNGTDRLARFYEFLQRIRQEAAPKTAIPHLPFRKPSALDRSKPGPIGLFYGRLQVAFGYRDPEMGKESDYKHPPDCPLSDRVWNVGTSAVQRHAEARRFAEDRLCNQYHWHLNKCQWYFRWYLFFQLVYMTVLLSAGWYASLYGRDFLLTALSTLGSLILLAFSEFMAYGTISLRYYLLADSLRQIHETYFGRDATPNSAVQVRRTGKLPARATNSEAEWRAIGELTDEVECTLSSEFRFWQLVHDTTTSPAERK
jgi:hypothetical protein